MNNQQIYQLIPKIMQEVGAVGKGGYNAFDKYKFRSIDDIYNALQPVLAKNGVFIVPRIISSIENTIQSQAGKDQIRIKIKVEYKICAPDGSFVESIFEGEGIDRSDKATNKAAQASFKYMVSQLFCLAFEGMEDADKESPEVGRPINNKTEPKKLSSQVAQTKVEALAHSAPEAVNSPVKVDSPAMSNNEVNKLKPIEKEKSHILNHAPNNENSWDKYTTRFTWGSFKMGMSFYNLGKKDTESLMKAIKSWKLKKLEENPEYKTPQQFEEFLTLASQYLVSLK